MQAQIIANAIIAASIYALLAASFSLIYSTTRFFHFAHGAVFTVAPYTAFFCLRQLELPLFAAMVIGIAVSVAIGSLLDIGVFRPLRRRKAGSLILLVASLGMYVLIQNGLSMSFGDDTKSLRKIALEQGFAIGPFRVTDVQAATIVAALFVTVSMSLWLRFGGLGRSFRAVADDEDLAGALGLSVNGVILIAFAIGSGIAGLAGILSALDVHMRPTMGLHALLMAVVAAIIGGIGSIAGIAAGAILLAFAQHFGAWWIGSEWMDTIAFALLVVFLLLRPHGFLGKPLRAATV